ncbi:toxin-antitoxin system YwqK family antitoxin [Marinoscillum sp.]|uniref:toxin-antitoxin system YwqK family antitoxin n=1 Tax=Marinoscillum sp. TaxID=2024838 RepID=UPI003BABDE20
MKNLILPLALCLLFSCDQINSFIGSKTAEEADNVVKNYYENGELKSIYTVNELRQKHGTAKIYKKNGTLSKSFEYENGEKIKAISYYKNGNPLMEINYKNDVKDGPFKRFYQNGKLESEATFKENFPGKGLKEYTSSGSLKKQYPELIVKGIDQMSLNGRYIIEVYFDKNPGRGTYYIGSLTEDTFLNYRLDEMERVNYRGRLVITPAPGVIIMEKLNFVGEFKTPTGNKYIVEKSFNLAIDNSF